MTVWKNNVRRPESLLFHYLAVSHLASLLFCWLFFLLVKLKNRAETSRVPSFKSFVKCKVLFKCELGVWFHVLWNKLHLQRTSHHCEVPYVASITTQPHNFQSVFQDSPVNNVFWTMAATSFSVC